MREKRFQDLTHPDDLAASEALFRKLVSTGEAFNLDKRYVKPDGSPVWVSNYVSLISDDEGRPSHAVAIVLDISQRKLAEQHRELLLSELNHRVKNTLATVQAIARQTLAGASDLDAFRGAFMSRLQALSKTHDLLAKDAWRSVELRDLVEAELAPYAVPGRRAPEIQGESLQLDPKSALALSLALHELATNAAKYGALSTPRGQVRVAWKAADRDGQRWLELRWSELDGPRVQTPERTGFGSRLVTEGIPHELGGEVELDFAVTGVVCTMRVPLPEPGASGVRSLRPHR